MDTDESEWTSWNWRTDGDIMVNGAFFVPSGIGLSTQYAKASSVDPKNAALIDQLTLNAGVFGDPRYKHNHPPFSLSLLLTILPVSSKKTILPVGSTVCIGGHSRLFELFFCRDKNNPLCSNI